MRFDDILLVRVLGFHVRSLGCCAVKTKKQIEEIFNLFSRKGKASLNISSDKDQLVLRLLFAAGSDSTFRVNRLELSLRV